MYGRLLSEVTDVLSPTGVTILPEIHEHYTIPFKIAEKGYFVYDFALPMLLLNSLYYGQTKHLKEWLLKSPNKQFTTLDHTRWYRCGGCKGSAS